jgi:phenylalanyl-tRNA synthetase beta subunit
MMIIHGATSKRVTLTSAPLLTKLHGVRADLIEVTLDELIVALAEHGEGKIRHYFYQTLQKHLTKNGIVRLK